MEIIKTVILSIVQGITEFFPVSSSGHLVLLEHFFKIREDKLILTVVLHGGTFFSVLFYYRKKVYKIIVDFFRMIFSYKQVSKEDKEYIYGIIIVTLITGITGFLLKDFFESLFKKPVYVSLALFFTGIILILTKFIKLKENRNTVFDSFFIGFAQTLAIIPGISRSGSTISTALYLGWDKEIAAEFSFIAFLPAMFGALILELPHKAVAPNLTLLTIGFLVSFFVGVLSIKYLISIIKNRKFYLFGIYCIIIALISFVYFVL